MDPHITKTRRDKLSDLLTRARGLAHSGSRAARLALADELQEFIVQAPPAAAGEPGAAEIAAMEKIARGVHDALLLGAVDERRAAITGNGAELTALSKKLQARGGADAHGGHALRREDARAVLAATSGAIAAIQDLRGRLNPRTGASAPTDVFGQKLERALQGLEELRRAAEALE